MSLSLTFQLLTLVWAGAFRITTVVYKGSLKSGPLQLTISYGTAQPFNRVANNYPWKKKMGWVWEWVGYGGSAAFLQLKCLVAADHIGARHSKPESRAITVFQCGESSWNLCNSISLQVTGISQLQVFSSVSLFLSNLSKLKKKKILFMANIV